MRLQTGGDNNFLRIRQCRWYFRSKSIPWSNGRRGGGNGGPPVRTFPDGRARSLRTGWNGDLICRHHPGPDDIGLHDFRTHAGLSDSGSADDREYAELRDFQKISTEAGVSRLTRAKSHLFAECRTSSRRVAGGEHHEPRSHPHTRTHSVVRGMEAYGGDKGQYALHRTFGS